METRVPPEFHPAKGALAKHALEASWQRSVASGLAETHQVRPPETSWADARAVRSRNSKLLKYAEPSVENTFEQMAGTGTVVVLADAEGIIVCSKGDADLMSGTIGPLFQPGVSWSEKIAGTNAIGTCVASRAPVTVDLAEHYLVPFRSLSGAAAPFFDSAGTIAGVFAAYSTSPAIHALPLIRTVAVLIENRMLVREMADEIVVVFHPVAEYLTTIKQAIAVFGSDGKLLGSNSAARCLLNLDPSDTLGKRFTDLFGFNFSLERFVDKARAMRGSQFAASLRDGRDVTMIVNVGLTGEAACSARTPTDAGHSTDQQQTTPRSARVLLKDLDLGDPQMQRAIQKASMILGSDIPLLIEGESGVGKEVFTAAFHNSGPRHNGPFVAVNCAAIPEGLIESELFGYEEGAFTGAKRKGFPGKILQANGGTLFLDEIGDMPLSLQGRLLRVLQERQVTPLGSTRSMPVDVSIVCATHRSMIEEVTAGRFREDLYYRLNGLRIRLPSLRERKDISCLIDFVINAESGGRKVEVAPDVRHALCTHPWPGNIRQLQMTLRTALAILRDGTELRLEHLPDELLPTEGSETPPQADAQPCDLAQIEMDAVRRAIAASDGNMSEAARVLGISRKTLYRKLEKLSAQSAAGQAAKEQIAPRTKGT